MIGGIIGDIAGSVYEAFWRAACATPKSDGINICRRILLSCPKISNCASVEKIEQRWLTMYRNLEQCRCNFVP